MNFQPVSQHASLPSLGAPLYPTQVGANPPIQYQSSWTSPVGPNPFSGRGLPQAAQLDPSLSVVQHASAPRRALSFAPRQVVFQYPDGPRWNENEFQVNFPATLSMLDSDQAAFNFRPLTPEEVPEVMAILNAMSFGEIQAEIVPEPKSWRFRTQVSAPYAPHVPLHSVSLFVDLKRNAYECDIQSLTTGMTRAYRFQDSIGSGAVCASAPAHQSATAMAGFYSMPQNHNAAFPGIPVHAAPANDLGMPHAAQLPSGQAVAYPMSSATRFDNDLYEQQILDELDSADWQMLQSEELDDEPDAAPQNAFWNTGAPLAQRTHSDVSVAEASGARTDLTHSGRTPTGNANNRPVRRRQHLAAAMEPHYDKVGNRWVAEIRAKEARQVKTFSVKKYGDVEAKRKAGNALREMHAKHGIPERTPRYNKGKNAWEAEVQINGKREVSSFFVSAHGEAKAKRLAENKLRELLDKKVKMSSRGSK